MSNCKCCCCQNAEIDRLKSEVRHWQNLHANQQKVNDSIRGMRRCPDDIERIKFLEEQLYNVKKSIETYIGNLTGV